MDTVEQSVQALLRNKHNVEILGELLPGTGYVYGVRARPYGKGALRDRMTWGMGETLQLAFCECCDNAEAGKYIATDWAYRPWNPLDNGATSGWR